MYIFTRNAGIHHLNHPLQSLPGLPSFHANLQRAEGLSQPQDAPPLAAANGLNSLLHSAFEMNNMSNAHIFAIFPSQASIISTSSTQRCMPIQMRCIRPWVWCPVGRHPSIICIMLCPTSINISRFRIRMHRRCFITITRPYMRCPSSIPSGIAKCRPSKRPCRRHRRRRCIRRPFAVASRCGDPSPMATAVGPATVHCWSDAIRPFSAFHAPAIRSTARSAAGTTDAADQPGQSCGSKTTSSGVNTSIGPAGSPIICMCLLFRSSRICGIWIIWIHMLFVRENQYAILIVYNMRRHFNFGLKNALPAIRIKPNSESTYFCWSENEYYWSFFLNIFRLNLITKT